MNDFKYSCQIGQKFGLAEHLLQSYESNTATVFKTCCIQPSRNTMISRLDITDFEAILTGMKKSQKWQCLVCNLYRHYLLV